jgi:hypothetical protein
MGWRARATQRLAGTRSEKAGGHALHKGNRIDRQNRGRHELRLDWEALLSSELFLKATSTCPSDVHLPL